MNLTSAQLEVSLQIIKMGFIPNWYNNFGKPALRIFCMKNNDEELTLYFSVDNICYDYSINMAVHRRSILLKVLEIIYDEYPENKNPKYDYMKRFDICDLKDTEAEEE